MNEEITRVLKMVEEGKIQADKGAGCSEFSFQFKYSENKPTDEPTAVEASKQKREGIQQRDGIKDFLDKLSIIIGTLRSSLEKVEIDSDTTMRELKQN